MIEYLDCPNKVCWINYVGSYPRAIIWPKWHKLEREGEYWIWDFYVEWDATAPGFDRRPRGKVNGIRICQSHHEEILRNIGKELAKDVKEQEAMSRWLQFRQNR